MSLILDALKKSENARQQKAGPALAAAPGTMDNRRGPIWPWIVAVVLMINAGLLALVLARQDKRDDAERVVAAQPDNPGSPAGPRLDTTAGAARPGRPATDGPVADGPERRPTVTARAPVLSDQLADGPAGAAQSAEEPDIVTLSRERRLRALQAVAGMPLPSPTTNPPASAPAAAPPRQGGTVIYEGEPAPAVRPGTVIYEGEETAEETPTRIGQATAPEPRPAAAPPAPTSGTLPSYQDLQLKGELSLAPMHVDIHVYSEDPAERFVFINMVKYREGEKTREGPVVETIDTTGAVMSHQGRRFVLPRD